jgi:hypothetical protein
MGVSDFSPSVWNLVWIDKKSNGQTHSPNKKQKNKNINSLSLSPYY